MKESTLKLRRTTAMNKIVERLQALLAGRDIPPVPTDSNPEEAELLTHEWIADRLEELWGAKG